MRDMDSPIEHLQHDKSISLIQGVPGCSTKIALKVKIKVNIT